MERDRTYKDIVHGESVGFSSLRQVDYWDTYEALKHERFVGQYELPMPEVGLIGDLRVRAKRPQPIPLTPEQEHLAEVRPLKNGITRLL